MYVVLFLGSVCAKRLHNYLHTEPKHATDLASSEKRTQLPHRSQRAVARFADEMEVSYLPPLFFPEGRRKGRNGCRRAKR